MTHMPAWGVAPRPAQMKKLLEIHPRFSREHDEPATVSSRESVYRAISDVHHHYHSRFRYTPDKKGDVWQPPIETETGLMNRPILTGDCEDWVFGMMDELETAGIPRGACLAVTCRLPGQDHMALVIRNEWTHIVSDVRLTAVPYWDGYSFKDCGWWRIQKAGSPYWQWARKPWWQAA